MIHLSFFVGICSCLQQQLGTLGVASATSIVKRCPVILHTQCTNNGDNDDRNMNV
jgi:hypothetical protein